MNPEEWITSKEGAEILDVPQPNFLYYAKTNQIAVKDPDSPHLDRLYSRADTIKIRKRLLSKKRAKRQEPPPIITDWLSPDDIPAILRLDQIVYDEMFLAEMERYKQWSEKNGQLAMAAFDARSNRQTMLAYIACLPLDESIILQVMRGEREEVDITPEEMQSYDRPGAYTLLANSAVVHPEHPYLLRRVMQGMIDAWVERFPERYVTKVYAQSVSERGDMLISNFFMQPRYDLAGGEYPAYELDMSRPGRSRIIREFQAKLKAKAPLPPELQWPPAQTQVQQPTQAATPVRAAISSLKKVTNDQEMITKRPPDTISISELADLLGIARSTLVEYIRTNEELPKQEQDPRLEHIVLPKQGRTGEHERYFTRAQVQAFKSWRTDKMMKRK